MASFEDTLDFLYAQLPMYHRIGQAAYKKDLTNTIALCNHLGNPQNKFKSVHIGGTNGKGSTTNYLASMFVEAGLKVGIYTSPHLIDFRERIKIGNQMIPKEFVVDFVERMKPLIAEIQPSFFELTVVMAFEYFATLNVDIAIIEVGLGGRLDSTNVITPELCIITNISFDHQQMLGDTLEKIAIEKAGIMKKSIPIIIGESNQDYNFVFEVKARVENSNLVYASEQVKWIESSRSFLYREDEIILQKDHLKPRYQIKNIKTSILSFYQLASILKLETRIEDLKEIIIRGIENRTKNTGFLGRWTELDYLGRRFILESAHNEAGIREFNLQLVESQIAKPIIVFGCVRDKDVTKIISLLPKSAEYILTQANIPRALPVGELAALFNENELQVLKKTNSVQEAISVSIELFIDHPVTIITGSVFVVGESLGYIQKT